MTTTSLAHLLRRLFLATALTSSIVATAVAPVHAQTQDSEKLDSVLRLRSHQLAGRSRVIVEFAGAPDVRVITGRRGHAGRRLVTHGAQVAEFDNRDLAGVASDPRVSRVVIDRDAFVTMERTGTAIGATLAREQFDVTGKGVGVALIDSGITSWHDDLYVGTELSAPNRVVAFKDFTDDASASQQPHDPFGHGTHVAGIIAGNGYDSDGRRSGIAPGAHLVGLKVLDGDGHGYISDVIEALDYAVAMKDVYNIRIINLSVASAVTESYRTDPLTRAARRAVDAGIVVIAAAGNLGQDDSGRPQSGGITSPGNAPWVLTVGASSHNGTAPRSDDTIGSFSSHGPTWIDFEAKPDLVAPGVGIESLSDPASTLYASLSPYLLSGTRNTWYKPYLSLSGTSMAAPVVTGTVALMLEANPALTPNAVKGILEYTAENRPDISPLVQGAGLVNAHGALRMARFFAKPRRGLGAPTDTIAGEQVAWSQQIIWGNYRVTGGVPLPGSNAWASNTRWGAVKTHGAPVVWGAKDTSNIVWSTWGKDNIVWSTWGKDNIVWSTWGKDNIVWSTWGKDNIVWSTWGKDNIVWSTWGKDNIVWSTWGKDNIVWSTWGKDNIVWSTWGKDNIVWSTWGKDNIVWSTWGKDNIVWSTAVTEPMLWPAP